MVLERSQDAPTALFCRIERCLSQHEVVVCGYVFGSTITRPHDAADLDVAVLFDTQMTDGNVLPPSVRLSENLKDALERADVDVVPLNDAPPTFRHEVLSTGRCVYAREETERLDFECRAEAAYYDYLPLKRIFDRATLHHILGEADDRE